MSHSIVKEKSDVFAARIVRLYQYLTGTKHEYTIAKQVLRSGTSVGANIAEALSGISRKDFLAKMYVALKECRETSYWLNLLHETGYMSDKEYDSIDVDCTELAKMLGSITKTTAESLTKNS